MDTLDVMDTLEVPVYVPAPLAHQDEPYYAAHRFKLLPWGRRAGKDRLDFTAAVQGHGPGAPEAPMWEGAAQGWWIAWIVRDFTQGKGIWLEEFLPRFKPAEPLIRTNETELRVTFPPNEQGNSGGIFLCTDRNIHSIRGLGKRLKGVVVNEAAWLDLHTAWLSVLRPMLVDNKGWAIFSSTTNSKHDGNPEYLTPSYFNRLCLEVRSGSRGPDWGMWHRTAYDNQAIDPVEVDALVAEYPPGSLQLKEEVFADLVPAGAGLAFPDWNPDVHLVEAFQLPSHWRFQAGMDWGLRHRSVVTLGAFGEDGDTVLPREWTWSDKDAYEAGFDFATALLTDEDLPGWPEVIWCDSAMNERTGVGGKTIFMEFQDGIEDARKQVAWAPELRCMAIPKGPGSRAVGYNLVTKALRWGPRLENGQLPRNRQPRLHIWKRGDVPACPVVVSDLATLSLDPKDSHDVLEDERHPADGYASLRYLLMGWNPQVRQPERDIPSDVHPGWLPTGQRRSRLRDPETVRQENLIVAQYNAQQRGQPIRESRYGRRER